MPPFFIPILAFIIWTLVIFLNLPLLKLNLYLSDQLVAPQFLISNLILILVWALSGPLTAVILSGLSALVVLYAALVTREPALFLQLLIIATLFTFLVFYLYAIQRHNNAKQIAKEKLTEELTLILEEEKRRDILKDALGQKIHRFLDLQRFSKELKHVKNLHEAAQKVATEAYEVLGKAESCVLYLVNESEQELSLAASAQRNNHIVREKEGNPFDQWVMKRNRAIVVEDVCNDFRFSTSSKPDSNSPRSICASPLATEKRVLGVLRASATQAGVFSADDLRLLDIISSLGAVTLRNHLLYERMQELAQTDSLTGLYLNRYFQERLSEEILRTHRSRGSFSVVLLDIDFFKHYNDEYGHPAGDLVLKNITALIMECLDSVDLAARYGGEEFMVLLPNRGKKEALALAERIRTTIEKNKFYLRRVESRVTVSLGVATYPGDGRTKEELIWTVDKNLYEAKRRGRNRVCGNI